MKRCLGLGVRPTSILILTATSSSVTVNKSLYLSGSLFICEMGMQIALPQEEVRFLAQYLAISRSSVNGECDSIYH